MDPKQMLSAELRTKRQERKITQEEAAERLDISVRWYRKVEKGESRPGFPLVCEIAREFQIDFAEFSVKKEETP